MKSRATLSCWLGALLSMLGTGLATGQSDPPHDKPATTETLAPAGVDAGRWQRIGVQLRANGLSTKSAQECLAPVQEAARLGLPADTVLTRVEEGTAKGVEANALQAAGRQRLATLQSAAEVVRQAGYGSRNTQHDQLIKSVALALESGLSVDTLRGVFAKARSGQSELMRSIVEAGETMRLSGMNEPTVRQMMADFTERNMRRTEVIRASRFAVQQHRSHVEGTRIRQQLWDRAGAGGRWSRGDNIAGAAGPGAGGPVDQGNGPTGSGSPSGAGGSPTSSGSAGASGGGNSGGGSAGAGGPSGSGGFSASPGTAPADAATGSGGPGGIGNSGSSGSGAQGANAPTDAGPQGTKLKQGR